MADATVTIASESINKMNKGDTLEVFFPSLNKTTTGIVRAIKVGASKGSTVIKWGFSAEDFTQFAIAVRNLESNKREAEKICPSLN
jgi:ribosomal protein L6P/L9E